MARFYFLFCIVLLITTSAAAQFGGHNVILIHGVWNEHFLTRPDKVEAKNTGIAYWEGFWGKHTKHRIDWGSHQRLEGGVAEHVFEQAQQLSEEGVCDNGCIAVVHSTGDLIFRYLLEHQDDWLEKPLDFLMTFDFAGAAGGSELAVSALNVALGGGTTAEKEVASFAFGIKANAGREAAGVLSDITPNVSRNMDFRPSQVPRLRIIGNGFHEGFLGLTHQYILGNDDGVIGFHSACASVTTGSFDSCLPYLGPDGYFGEFNAPVALWHNHFPLLVADNSQHTDLIHAPDKKATLVPMINDIQVGRREISLKTQQVESENLGNFFGVGFGERVLLEASGTEGASRTIFNLMKSLPRQVQLFKQQRTQTADRTSLPSQPNTEPTITSQTSSPLSQSPSNHLQSLRQSSPKHSRVPAIGRKPTASLTTPPQEPVSQAQTLQPMKVAPQIAAPQIYDSNEFGTLGIFSGSLFSQINVMGTGLGSQQIPISFE